MKNTLIKLLALASWFENSDNDLLTTAEEDGDEALKTVSDTSAFLAFVLKSQAELLTEQDNEINPEKLEDLAALANMFDDSDDEFLKKQASVIDQLLLTIAAPKNAVAEAKEKNDKRIEALKEKYHAKKPEIDQKKLDESEKAIKKSTVYKENMPLEQPLKTRYCPDHAGEQTMRVSEHVWQCPLDHKIYDYEAGFTTLKGEKVPGTCVENQTPINQNFHTSFDTRETKLGLK